MKPNKYPPCQKVYNDYYECLFVKEVNFGKFVGACGKFKTALDDCNVGGLCSLRLSCLKMISSKKIDTFVICQIFISISETEDFEVKRPHGSKRLKF